MKKNEQHLRDLWDIINICIMDSHREQRDRKKAAEIILEGVTAQTFPNVMKDRNLHIQGAH